MGALTAIGAQEFLLEAALCRACVHCLANSMPPWSLPILQQLKHAKRAGVMRLTSVAQAMSTAYRAACGPATMRPR